MARKKLSSKNPDVLVIDIGGTKVKFQSSAHGRTGRFKSGRKMTPGLMVEHVLQLTERWKFDVVSIGFPGPVVHGRPAVDPENLGDGWTRFDFKKAFGKPVKIINDAAMQALGSYEGGRMLFLGLGTGVGSTMIVDDMVIPLELGELRYSNNALVKDVLQKKSLKKKGAPSWEKAVHTVAKNLKAAFVADYVVIGGGNEKKVRRLPPGARRGSNRFAFRGGSRLWQKSPITAKKHTLIIT